MTWEQRGGQSYYYRSVRAGTRVTKQYVGSGVMGVLAADLDAEEREEKALERDRIAADCESWEALELPTREVEDLSDQLMTAVLLTEGYRRHDRGEWRRRRGQ